MSTRESHAEHKNKNRGWLAIIGGFVLLLGIGAVLISTVSPAATTGGQGERASADDAAAHGSLPTGGPPLEAGDLPYAFTLADLEGNYTSLHEFIGKPLIINYWASWCGPCRIEMPHLQATYEARQADGLALLALNQDEATPEVAAFVDEFGLSFTQLLDEGNGTSQNYGVGRTLPTTFFINADGEITAVHRGPMTQSQIDGYLAETIPGA